MFSMKEKLFWNHLICHRVAFSASSMSLRTLPKVHRFVSENKIMIIVKLRFMMKRIITDFKLVALPGDFI